MATILKRPQVSNTDQCARVRHILFRDKKYAQQYFTIRKTGTYLGIHVQCTRNITTQRNTTINLLFGITGDMPFYRGKKLLRIQRAIKRIDYNIWDNKIFNGFFERFIFRYII